MGGSVSLGAFSGGALSQVIEDLASLNDPNIKIDAVPGASGGDVNNVRKLQRSAWVNQISTAAVAKKPTDGEWKALLNRDIVDQISADGLRWQEGDQPNPRLLADRVVFTSSITELSGFKGFLDQKFRSYDFAQGRAPGRDWMRQLQADRGVFNGIVDLEVDWDSRTFMGIQATERAVPWTEAMA